MALDYRKCAEEIFSHLGGKDNIISAAHCATRLRLVIADNSKLDIKALENVEGVQGLFDSNGQLQLIIGTGTVNKVYDEFLAVTGLSAATKADVKAAAASRMPLWKKILKTPGDVFVPILPAIVASGLMMGIVEAIPKFAPAFGQTDWFAFLDLVANTAFVMLPVLVAISAARVFGGNIFLGAVIGFMMVHPALLNAWNVGSADAINSFFGVTDGAIPTWKLFFFNVQKVGYQGHVIPVILAVLLMSVVEKWLHKKVPEMIDLFVTPLLTVFITSFVTFTIIGPIFSVLENWVLAGAEWLASSLIGAVVMGAIYPLTVVMGLHHMYNVIEAGMIANTGLNTWMPIASAANFAQFGACLAVALKVRNQKVKAVALPSSLSAALGITEPAIFGVNFRFMKPFICGMAGGAVGSFFGALFGLGAPVYGVTGIPAIPAVNKTGLYLVELLIAAGVAFALTTFIWKEETEEEEGVAEKAAAAAPEAPAYTPEKAVITCAGGTVMQPTPGKVIPYTEIPDQTFAQGILGTGVGVQPDEGIVVAPFDGVVTTVAETKHAVGLALGDMELLIHVGVDTVNMAGDGFETFVTEGQEIKTGDPLIRFDRDKIKAAGYSDTVVVLVTNSYDYEDSIAYPGV